MTLHGLGTPEIDSLHRCAVWISAGGTFCGSGFLASTGLVVTAAHVVVDAETRSAEVEVHHSSGTYTVPAGGIRAEPRAGDGGRFHPYPDLAALSIPQWSGHPVLELAKGEAEPGTEVTAVGFSLGTPSPGVQPETLALRVVGRSGAFTRVLGDGVREGYSGSMLLGSDGLVCGVLKGSRSYRDDQGGWFIPLAALAEFLGMRRAAPVPAGGETDRAGDGELVEALMAFSAMARSDSRYDLLDKMGDHLGLPHSFESEDRPERRDHLYRLVRRCRHYRDERAALVAVYTAMEELAPYDGALERLRLVIGRAIGGWESA